MTGPGLPRALAPAPRYGSNALADVMVSAAALWRPVSEDPEARELFPDRLGLAGRLGAEGRPAGPYRNVCVVLVDGLGDRLLSPNLGYTGTLRKASHLGVLDAAFPSTTAVSLATLGTGAPPSRTGMVGYDAVDPDRGVVVNQLSGWDPAVDPRVWQPLPTVFERLTATESVRGSGEVVTVSRNAYGGSALTEAVLRGGEFVGTGTTTARISAAADRLAARTPMFMYLYWAELDQVGHRHGSGSDRWLEQLEELDAGLRKLMARSGEETLVLLTADHGMVDVAAEDRIDYSAMPGLLDGVALTAGEPRMVQLHLEDPDDEAARSRLVGSWQEFVGDRALVLDRGALEAAGYFGDPAAAPMRAGVRRRIGDVLVAATGPLALYDLRRVRREAMEMVGQHGSWTAEEREVPLLALRN